MNSIERRAFILPGEEIAVHLPELLALLKRCHTTWETFVHLSLQTLLDHVNRGGLEDLEQALARSQSRVPQDQIAHDETIEDIIVDVMNAIDCDEESTTAPDQTYLTISDGVIALYNNAVQYVPRIFDDRFATSQGMPSEIRVERTMGYDIVLTVCYLIHR